MKVSKFLVVTLAALFPALGCAKMVTYSYPAVIQSPTDGMLFTASKQRLFHEALDNVHYSVKVLDGCQTYCDLEGIDNCDNHLDSFNVVAQCADYRGKENFLKEVGASRVCNKKESLSVYLKAPLKTPASVSVEIEITFDDEKMHVLKVMGQLKKSLPQEFIDRIVKQEEEKLRQLEEQHDAAHLAVVRSTAKLKRAEAAVVQADIELQRAEAESQRTEAAYNASKRELIQSVGEICAELISALE